MCTRCPRTRLRPCCVADSRRSARVVDRPQRLLSARLNTLPGNLVEKRARTLVCLNLYNSHAGSLLRPLVGAFRRLVHPLPSVDSASAYRLHSTTIMSVGGSGARATLADSSSVGGGKRGRAAVDIAAGRGPSQSTKGEKGEDGWEVRGGEASEEARAGIAVAVVS